MSKRKKRLYPVSGKPANPVAVEQASQLDRQWFAGHPTERRRIRPVIPGECAGIPADVSHVVVTRLADGIRHKRFVTVEEVTS